MYVIILIKIKYNLFKNTVDYEFRYILLNIILAVNKI